MLNLDVLTQLLNDRALRGQVQRVIAGKIRADAKSLEVGAQLSRSVLEMAARARAGDVPSADGSQLRELIKEHLDYYETLVNQMLTFNQRLLDKLQGLPAAGAPLTMRLRGPLHTIVRAPFRLENNRSSPIAVSFEITPFVSESGAEFISAEVAFDPPSLDLKPGQEARIEVIISIAEGFRPGSAYYATVTIRGLEHAQLLVHLQVEPSEAKAAAVNDAARPSKSRTAAAAREGAPPATTASAPRSSARPKARSKKSPRAKHPNTKAATPGSQSKRASKKRAGRTAP